MTVVQRKTADKNNQNEDQKLTESRSSRKTGFNGVGLMVEVTSLAWNLVTPIVGGVLLGHFLDNRTGKDFTWTLSLLVLGILIAFMNLYELNVEHGYQRSNDEKNRMMDQGSDNEEK